MTTTITHMGFPYQLLCTYEVWPNLVLKADMHQY